MALMTAADLMTAAEWYVRFVDNKSTITDDADVPDKDTVHYAGMAALIIARAPGAPGAIGNECLRLMTSFLSDEYKIIDSAGLPSAYRSPINFSNVWNASGAGSFAKPWIRRRAAIPDA